MTIIKSLPKQVDDTKQTIAVSDTFQIHFTSDINGNELLDTIVNIYPAFKRDCICVITGSDIQNFVNDFTALIAKYRI